MLRIYSSSVGTDGTFALVGTSMLQMLVINHV